MCRISLSDTCLNIISKLGMFLLGLADNHMPFMVDSYMKHTDMARICMPIGF